MSGRLWLAAVACGGLAMGLIGWSVAQSAGPTTTTAPAKDLTLDLGAGVTMKFLRVEPGEFVMGSPETEKDRERDEVQHKVRITKPFYLGTLEVTQEQYQALMGKNPSDTQAAKNPVESVSWDDAAAFCRKLAEKTGRMVRLPTEAEWEYACRAGTTTPFNTGATINTDQANYDGTLGYGDGPAGEYRMKPVPVGSFKPNAWGLFDMHGNVSEWCADWYGKYGAGEQSDPTGPKSGENRVLRGGSWNDRPASCRSALRVESRSQTQSAKRGFRVAVDLK